MENFTSYYDSQFASSSETGSIYEPFTPLLKAAHEARMDILDRLPIGDLSEKVIVDFGTGSWGFACIYPRLQQCKLAIGIDISSEAVAISESRSRDGDYPYGERYKYLVSDGLTIPLDDHTADVFFTGECIEHVENTDAFLDEIYRVLKPGGILILTTPNPNPWFYRTFGLEFSVGPEHIALMGYDELASYLEPRFETMTWQGYNLSVHPDLDGLLTDEKFAKAWASASIENPRDACGFVVMAKARRAYSPVTYSRATYRLSSDAVRCSGIWTELPIHIGLSAHMAKAGSELYLQFAGDQLVVLLWMHDWSGIAEVSVDGLRQRVDLFSLLGGFKRLVYRDLDPNITHTLLIQTTGEKNRLAKDDQVLFFSASAYEIVGNP
jgi:SAM-dependent methyltransferase